MSIGTGSAWVRRWFAKPLDTGSIPARASSVIDRLGGPPPLRGYWPRQWRFWLGLRVAWWALLKPDDLRSFASGLIYPIETAGAAKVYDSELYARYKKMAVRAEQAEKQCEKFKAEAIAARKDLSRMKRK